MMKSFVGIDLGSTTSKAIVLDEDGIILGRGITNSRSNYDLVAQIAKQAAFSSTRFTLLRESLKETLPTEKIDETLSTLTRAFRLEEHLLKLRLLHEHCQKEARVTRYRTTEFDLPAVLAQIFDNIEANIVRSFGMISDNATDFFRDLANSEFIRETNRLAQKIRDAFELLIGIFDKSIIKVENEMVATGFDQIIGPAMERLKKAGVKIENLTEAVETVSGVDIEETSMVGTGYGRQRLPFPKEAIRSEILCHGLGAHFLFPDTSTVLDIGGQDTKAIQVNSDGVVISFQMNDRCAAGCGRYLGYIADEMNLGLHELGPLAMTAKRTPKINSTCTVFAGAELRNRLLSGETRQDILAGLHRAIILRAMSLLARSGGVNNEFTFTGGVAKNNAAVAALRHLVDENYGRDITINIHPDSIYTGALGAALFALNERENISKSFEKETPK